MRLLNKTLSWLLYAAVITLMIFALFANFLIIAQALFSPLSVIQGHSMNPAIQENDAVIATGAGPDQLSIGDVVIFNDPDNYQQSIIHRIVDFDEEKGTLYAMTKGDANTVADPFMVPVDRVYGKVRVVLPKVGFFLSYLRSYPGFVTCVLCPFGLLLLYLVAKWYLEKTSPGETLFSLVLIPSS
jgi:signal peptidase I